MVIEKAKTADLATIKICARHAYQIYIKDIGREPAPMVADFAAQIAEGIIHVARDNRGAVLGFICFYPRDDHMHLENVAVSPASHGLGVGKALISFCEDQARKTGLEAVELYTNVRMTANLSLYPHLGYVETHRMQEDGFDRVFFRKELRAQ
ncbi:GNAT family N-acetyltransferase [Coralliovum pocilloporae]|uniref:GNAT family N-acetyltransferase n=1 Tax=Coralliovum pocilloporae TaxID=3066369 RepID=UPI003307633A